MTAHVQIACATQGCFAIITLHPDDEARLRRTHEIFYCPAGHQNYFAGQTPDQKRIEQLEQELRWSEETSQARRERWEAALASAEFLAHGVRVCPFGCGWSAHRQARGVWEGDEEALGRFLDRVGRDLSEHLVVAHNATRKQVALLLEHTS